MPVHVESLACALPPTSKPGWAVDDAHVAAGLRVVGIVQLAEGSAHSLHLHEVPVKQVVVLVGHISMHQNGKLTA